MKPKNFTVPFAWNDRRVVIHDRVWYIPQITSESTPPFEFQGWGQSDFFENNLPVHVEYCSGNGAWIAAKAAMNPMINWVAVERKFARVRKIWGKIKSLGLSNLIVVCGEACYATKNFFPSNSVQQIYINFPDPWPKRHHAKNRLIQPEFVEEMSRILTDKGKLTVVTDDKNFSSWTIKILESNEHISSAFPEPFYVNEMQDYGTSYFDQLWREKGRSILYHQYQRMMTAQDHENHRQKKSA